MSDNTELSAGSGGDKIATDEVTYSGDTTKVQLNRLVHLTGAEGAKTLHEILFAEDAAHSSGDYGFQVLLVRNDDLASLAGVDGDYTPGQADENGALYVNPCPSAIKHASGVAAGGAPGADDMVAAVAARKIRVHAFSLVATSATLNSVFIDNVDNDLWGNLANPFPMSIDPAANTLAGIVMPFNEGGWFTTDTVNEALTLNSSTAQDIIWTVTYTEVL